MKRYEHLRLGMGNYAVWVETTSDTVGKRLVSEVEQYVGEQIEVEESGYRYALMSLRSRNYEVHAWLIGHLCGDGWEPYAVWGWDPRGLECEYFRREIELSMEEPKGQS